MFLYQKESKFYPDSKEKKKQMYATLHHFNTHTASTKKEICKYLHLLSCTLNNSHDSFLYPVAIHGKK